jgi:alpha-1,3-glucan synthase
MFAIRKLLSLFCLLLSAFALRYDPIHEGWNLNLNQSATDPLHYWGEWDNHTFHPSPKSWRFPFYCLTLDRYVDGDPTNNEANGSTFEHDWTSNQFRFGGDARGMMNNLVSVVVQWFLRSSSNACIQDYIQGMGIKVLGSNV